MCKASLEGGVTASPPREKDARQRRLRGIALGWNALTQSRSQLQNLDQLMAGGLNEG